MGCQRETFVKELPGETDGFPHRLLKGGSMTEGENIGLPDVVAGQQILRQVDAALLNIDTNVLPEVGELQTGAGVVTEKEESIVAITAEFKHEAAHGVGGVDAIIEDLRPIAVAGSRLVVLKGFDQADEVLKGKVAAGDGAAKRDKNGVLVAIVGEKQGSPPSEEAKGFNRITNLVTEIIRPAAEGIDVIKILMEMLGQKEADYVEIFVVMGGEPAGVMFRFRMGPAMAHRRLIVQEVGGFKE